ncbi:Nac domain-containing protein, partial [Thalictrum thalictroides]
MMKPLRLPPGFQFTPSDSDLISHYLKKKINGEPLPIVNLIKDRDLYGKETPFQIFESCSSSFDSSVFNKWMYFFTKIKKKFSGNPSAKRIDRIVGNGSWKCSNTTKIYDENNKNLVIGYKTLLNFIVKSPEKENNTNEEKKQTNSWILYEYTLKGSDAIDKDSIWAVCKFRKGGKLRKDSHDNPPPSKRERPPSV